MIEEAIKIGKKLAEYHLIDGASGNLSFRDGDKIVITKTGVCLDDLEKKDFISLRFGERNGDASSDLTVHERIYEKSDYRVVLHCHGAYNVALSFTTKKIKPIDLEGKIFLKEIAFIEGEFGSEELANKIAEEVKERGFAVVKGHGIYVASDSFDKAFKIASYVEHSCQVYYLHSILKILESKKLN